MSKWISIKESLPTDDLLKVVRYADTSCGVKRHIGVALSRYYLPSNQGSRKYWCFEFGSCQQTKVTHWADLPEGGEL